jgi:hypothetical protein
MVDEMNDTTQVFYSKRRILRRALSSMWRSRGLFSPFVTLATNLSFKINGKIDTRSYKGIDLARGDSVNAR